MNRNIASGEKVIFDGIVTIFSAQSKIKSLLLMRSPVVFAANTKATINLEPLTPIHGKKFNMPGCVLLFINLIHSTADRFVLVVVDPDFISEESFGIGHRRDDGEAIKRLSVDICRSQNRARNLTGFEDTGSYNGGCANRERLRIKRSRSRRITPIQGVINLSLSRTETNDLIRRI